MKERNGRPNHDRREIFRRSQYSECQVSYTAKLLPMTDFTLEDLMDLTKMEKEMMNELYSSNINDHEDPSNETVNFLLAYSKALSIRKSSSTSNIRLVLN